MSHRILISLVLCLALSFLFTSTALAHEGTPRLEISAERMNPGGVIEVRGVNFEFEEVVALALIGTEIEIPLGEITADTEGIFLQIVALPVDLKEGAYHFHAVTDDHEILSPALLVQGTAILNEQGGGQGLRDEDDPLLAPMPAYPAAADPALSASPNPSSKSGSLFSSAVIFLAIVIALGIAFIINKRTLRGQ